MFTMMVLVAVIQQTPMQESPLLVPVLYPQEHVRTCANKRFIFVDPNVSYVFEDLPKTITNRSGAPETRVAVLQKSRTIPPANPPGPWWHALVSLFFFASIIPVLYIIKRFVTRLPGWLARRGKWTRILCVIAGIAVLVAVGYATVPHFLAGTAYVWFDNASETDYEVRIQETAIALHRNSHVRVKLKTGVHLLEIADVETGNIAEAFHLSMPKSGNYIYNIGSWNSYRLKPAVYYPVRSGIKNHTSLP